MPYVAAGVIRPSRPIFRLQTATYVIWTVVNYVKIFFGTMFSLKRSDDYKRTSGASKKSDDDGPPSPRGPPRRLVGGDEKLNHCPPSRLSVGPSGLCDC